MKSYIRISIMTILTIGMLMSVSAQKNSYGFSISNNTIGFPVVDYPGIFYSQFHPGADFFFRHELNDNKRHRLYSQMHVGLYYHRFIQTLVHAYPTLGYELHFSDRWAVGTSIGAGYGLSFEGSRAFRKNDQGEYETKPFFGARSQYLLAAHISASYQFTGDSPSEPSLIFGFRTLLQGTYVSSYVPLIPINTFYLGLEFPIVKEVMK